jgi:hypothetical protein
LLNPEKPQDKREELKPDLQESSLRPDEFAEGKRVSPLLKEAEPSPELVLADSPAPVAADQNGAARQSERWSASSDPPQAVQAAAEEVEQSEQLQRQPCEVPQNCATNQEIVDPRDAYHPCASETDNLAVAESRRQICQSFHEVSKSAVKVSEGRLDRKTRQHLLEIIANPHALEHEWQRACTLLGDRVAPVSKYISYKARVRLAMTASWLVLLYLPYLYCVVPKSYDFLKDLSMPQAARAAVAGYEMADLDIIKRDIDRCLPTTGSSPITTHLTWVGDPTPMRGSAVQFRLWANGKIDSPILINSNGLADLDVMAFDAVAKTHSTLPPRNPDEPLQWRYFIYEIDQK